MLGNSERSSLALVLVAGLGLLATGCPKNVPQDSHSGADGKYKGAHAITLDPMSGEGDAGGIVTYPGGDRIDWKSIELPKDQKGSIEVDLKWKPPRPGLDLAFDVYDQYGQKIGGVKPKKPSAAKKSHKKSISKTVTLDPVKGTIYIEVYASNRMDAGKYNLHVKFTQSVAAIHVINPATADIPMPPKLAAVPPPCDPANIDPKNPECKGVSPPCDPAKPDPNNPNCKGVSTPCNPQALDPLNPSCLPYYPDCDPLKIDPKNPKCKDVVAPKAEPIAAQIIATEPSGSGTVITINRGTKDGVSTKWTGAIVDSSGNPIAQGSFTIFKAVDKTCFAKVKMAKTKVDQNLDVMLQPP